MVRIYCLANITKIDPSENPVNIYPYFNGSDELYPLRSESVTVEILKNATNLEVYRLTEICIGYKEISYFNEVLRTNKTNVKQYLLNIFQKDLDLLEFKMLRGGVKFEKLDYPEGTYDLTIATSKIFFSQLDFDIRVRIRCIKTTVVKGIISEDEMKLYETYANEIEDICHTNDNDIDNDETRIEVQEQVREFIAFEMHTFELPNKSKPNVLRTMISDINILVKLLCNPENGSFQNIKDNMRCNQRIKCLLKDTKSWEVSKPRYGELSNQSKKYLDLQVLHWKNVNLCPERMNKIDVTTLRTIMFKNITIFDDSKQLISGFPKNSFPSLKMLMLIGCYIKEIPDYFLEMLPFDTLEMLCLPFNDIKKIPEKISRFKKLHHLMLHSNLNLKDDGIPWDCLPSTIVFLTLDNTKITKIPKNIQRFERLYELHVGNAELENIEWQCISPRRFHRLCIYGGKKDLMQTLNLSAQPNFGKLVINNTEIQTMQFSELPQSIQELDLSKNKLKIFETENLFSNLTELLLDNNELETISWKFLPSTLTKISINNNGLKCIGDISHLINLETLSANNNSIKCILTGMNELKNLKRLELSHNKFRYSDDDDLIESLWMKLPICFLDLDLSYNNLKKIPCYLKNLNILKLKVNKCQISQICPHFYTAYYNKNHCHLFELRIKIEDNPDLKYLPFLPQFIFQPALSSKIEPEDKASKMGFVLSVKGKNYVSAAEFPRTKSLKPIYPFKTYLRENNLIECKCCSNCGGSTNFAVKKQLMVMDFTLKVIKNGKKKYYPAGQWNSNVLIKLCKDCFEPIKNKTDQAYLQYMANLFNQVLYITDQFIKMNMNTNKKHKNDEESTSIDWKKPKNSTDGNSPLQSTLHNILGSTHEQRKNDDYDGLEEYQILQTLTAPDSDIFYTDLHPSTTSNATRSNMPFMVLQHEQPHHGTCNPQHVSALQTLSCNTNVQQLSGEQILHLPNDPALTLNTFCSNPDPSAVLVMSPKYQNMEFLFPYEAECGTFYPSQNICGNQYSLQPIYLEPQQCLPPEQVQCLTTTANNPVQEPNQALVPVENNNNDIEFLHSIYHPTSPIFAPTEPWLKEKCRAFGIPFFENVCHKWQTIHDIQKYTIHGWNDVVNVPSNGHCGYSSISVLLCGSDFYHGQIRKVLCSKIIDNNDPNFEKLDIFRDAKKRAKAKQEINPSIPCDKDFWMDDADLAAAASLINCNIYVLNSIDDWQIYGPKTIINGQMNGFINYDPTLPTLLMQNKSGDHFTPVKNVCLKQGLTK